MRVNPINTNNNTSFRAVIKPSESLKEGFTMMEKYASSGTMKDMNSVKDFLDSLARISESQKVSKFKIEIDKERPEYTYTKINGRRISGGSNEGYKNLQDSYLVVEGTKRYASKLEDSTPSILDILKSKIEEAELALDELKEVYGRRLQAELEQAKTLIFKKAE